MTLRTIFFPILGLLLLGTCPSLAAQEVGKLDPPPGFPPETKNPAAVAKNPETMKAYEESIPGTPIAFRMVPIPGGGFNMGSPAEEEDRKKEEGPVHEVEISPFWMGVYEVSWDEYQEFQFSFDITRRGKDHDPSQQEPWADAVSRPTPPYVPMDFGMGVDGFPAACMTQFAAKQYTKWLSMKTGRFYRLPTEAEWEYACRAGTTTAWSFGDDPELLDEYAWYFDNADDAYKKVGQLKPNPWGLFDMHGNVAEWVLDAWDKDFYGTFSDEAADNPIHWPETLYLRVVRGGSWDDDPDRLRSAARTPSKKGWKVQDPQLPKSIWYLTDAPFVGFRVVRPFSPPQEEERSQYWEADLGDIRRVESGQRQGER